MTRLVSVREHLRLHHFLNWGLCLSLGFLGSALHGMMEPVHRAQGTGAATTRVGGLEIVGERGEVVAALRQANGQVGLEFYDQSGVRRARIGLERSGRPAIGLADRQGEELIAMEARPSGKPQIRMADPDSAARVTLGHVEQDAPSSVLPKYWALVFSGLGSTPYASIGMELGVDGAVSARDRKGNMIWMPKPRRGESSPPR